MKHTLSRRLFLGSSVAAPVVAWAFRARAGGVRYTLAARPERALLGERVMAVLRVVAADGPAEAVTFDDPSLTLNIQRAPAGGAADLQRAFPNRKVVQQGQRIVRYSGAPARRRLARGEHVERTFDLLDQFPETVLGPGDLVVSYELEDGEKPVQSPQARVTMESGPAAVPKLLDMLADGPVDARDVAASLLHRMTAHVARYDPEAEVGPRQQAIERWRRWWEGVGRKLPWSFTTPGAVFDGAPRIRSRRATTAPPRSQRSKFLGGVAYERRRLDAAGGNALAGALGAWRRDPAKGAAALSANVWVADRVIPYPPETFLVDPGDEAAAALESALRLLADLAAPPAADRPAVAIILATIARMPHTRFVEGLAALESRAKANPAWRETAVAAGELLEVLATD